MREVKKRGTSWTQAKKLNVIADQNWFDKGSMEFFSTKLERGIDGYGFFTTSEQISYGSLRLTTVRWFDHETGRVDTVSEFYALNVADADAVIRYLKNYVDKNGLDAFVEITKLASTKAYGYTDDMAGVIAVKAILDVIASPQSFLYSVAGKVLSGLPHKVKLYAKETLKQQGFELDIDNGYSLKKVEAV